jgi:hypothetical protein
MARAYKASLKNGYVSVDDPRVVLPAQCRVMVSLLDDGQKSTAERIMAKKQNQSLKRFFAAIDAVEGEPITDEDLADFEKNRVSFRKEFAE